MGTVFPAQDLGHERFLRQIKISARLNHPHILTLIDSGQVGDILYYVVTYLEGETLRQRIELDGQMDLEEAVGLTGQITAALDYAHGQGVIHRDIKPENILIHRGEAIVSDFGIAVGLETAKTGRLTFTGTSAQVVLAKILTADPTPLSEVREDISAEASVDIVEALACAPEDRFATAGEFGTALHDAILGSLADAGRKGAISGTPSEDGVE